MGVTHLLGVSYDLATLLVAVALANAFCAGARFLLWRFHPDIPGLGMWALAGGLSVLSFFMLVFFKSNPWVPLLATGELLAVLGMTAVWDGFRRFVGRSSLSNTVWFVVMMITLFWISSPQFQHSAEIRAVGNAVFISVFSALIAQELFTAGVGALFTRLTGWVFAANATVFMVRILMTGLGNQTKNALNPDGFADFMLLWWLCITIAITIGMVLMTAERLQADLDRQANRDPLTGALNRRSFALFAEKAIAQSRRYHKPLSALLMDLDDFKQINDQFGHEMGDNILCGFVTIADRVLRTDDIFCRYGGEEFVALLPNTSAEQALVAAERLRTTLVSGISDMPGVNDQEMTVSIGIAALGEGEDFDSLLRRADTALYKAKDMGRNCCRIAEEQYSQEAKPSPQMAAQREG